MSERYPGGFITKTPVVPTPSSAPGIWTLDQQLQAQKAGTWPFGGPFNYIEDVFSTYLYTGTGATQTITNGIDLAGNGGLNILKRRNGADGWYWQDSARGFGYSLASESTNGQWNPNAVTATTTGFTINTTGSSTNASGGTYASWTFRKQPKFFDVVTYTGNGGSPQVINHNLGSVPGCVIIKRTDSTGDWYVSHRYDMGGSMLLLNSTAAAFAAGIGVTSTTFSVYGATGTALNNVNGATYVAYLFAHDAGGFGLTGTDNVISCGSYVGNGSLTGPNVNLGYEPQWLLVKNATTAGPNWFLFDNMRGVVVGGNDARLVPNTSDAESSSLNLVEFNATGFQLTYNGNAINGSGDTYIYIAIRRGPMKTPTSGTSVFEPVTTTSANFIKGSLEASDMGWFKDRTTVANWFVSDRLRGIMSYYNPTLYTNLTDAEATPTTGDTVTSTSSEGTGNGKLYFGGAGVAADYPLGYSFKRAPGFFDEVCYTGTGAVRTINHNLGVAPEMMIVKSRSGVFNWIVYSAATGNGGGLYLNTTSAYFTENDLWNNTTPTSTVFSLGLRSEVNQSTATYVAYLFATCPGVSKVGSYTGTGATQTISCGFTGGARFVLIKRTDTTGDWYVWDSARGMVAGTDPSLLLNSTAAEVNANSIYTTTGGFQIVSTAAGINASGGTYIYLAIA